VSISDFLKAVSRGFISTRSDILIAVSLVGGFILFLLLFSLILKKTENARVQAAGLRRYNERIREIDLTINELDFLNQLALYLRKPWKKYLLVTNENTFLNCCEKLKEEGAEYPVNLIERIERKAGFSKNGELPASAGTRNLSEGMPVKVEYDSGRLCNARVTKVREEVFSLEGEALVSTKAPVVVHIPHRTGLLAFETRTVGPIKEGRLELRHSETVPEKRWGELGRKSRDFTVYVKADGKESVPMKTVLYRVSARGAYIENPDGALSRKDDVRILLTNSRQPGGTWVNGEVRGESLDRRELYVHFSHTGS
jgi:hypothetical protein